MEINESHRLCRYEEKLPTFVKKNNRKEKEKYLKSYFDGEILQI